MIAIVALEDQQRTIDFLTARGVDAWALGTVSTEHDDVRLV